MSLDALVRCTCFERGKTKPHPFPKLVRFSKIYGPDLKPEATEKQFYAHDEWYEKSCPHHGYAAGAFLGNIWLVAKVREHVAEVRRRTRKRFPILTNHVIYDGTHTGDYIPAKYAPALLKEVETLRTLTKDTGVRRFLDTLARICKVSIKTGNPIQF
jgi:hypothetical protein